MRRIIAFWHNRTGQMDSTTTIVIGGIVGAIGAVYAFSGLNAHTIRPVIEPILHHVGLVWPS